MHKGAGFWAETRILTRGRWLATFSTLFNTKERVFPVTHKNFHTCQVEFWPETQQTGCCLGFYFSSSAQWISVAGHPGRTSIQFSTHWLCEQKMAEQTAWWVSSRKQGGFNIYCKPLQHHWRELSWHKKHQALLCFISALPWCETSFRETFRNTLKNMFFFHTETWGGQKLRRQTQHRSLAVPHPHNSHSKCTYITTWLDYPQSQVPPDHGPRPQMFASEIWFAPDMNCTRNWSPGIRRQN